ncbi:MAG TPA: hypothetical protein VFQ05_10015 [Candidatus Eisenbacteria bacterium]|nr:hypothetical protein [Candidatus Eisenbacteria bacterium]
MTSRVRTALALALVLATAALLHAGSLEAPFFADDYLFLDQARGRSLPALLASPDPLGNYLRPVSRQVWFWTIASVSGESARAFHLANLLLFLGILLLLYRVARRFLPFHAALSGVAVVAVHHAADVPLLWASGSQDLLAVLGSLAAIELHAAGRRGWAALAMALALLSKETVVAAPLLAIWLARREGESAWVTVRRGWPQLATLASWAVGWLATSARRPVMGLEVSVTPEGIPATLLHLLQVTLGLEVPHRGLGSVLHVAPPVALIPALLGVGWLAFTAVGAPRTGRFAVALRGLAWALLGAMPVVAVAAIWSAYYYLFSVCGMALVIGALVARSRPWVALLPLLIVGTMSANARHLSEFAIERDPWSTQSHLNRHYFDRGMRLAERVLDDLRRQRPRIPPRSTLYFSGLPHSIAFQAGDGPLVRWAYRDSTLRSYYFTGFRLAHARRGSLFFFSYRRDSLAEIEGPDSLRRVALALMFSDAPLPARDVLALDWERSASLETAYRVAWVELTLGGLHAARPWLQRAGVTLALGPTPEIEGALESVARGDTAAAIRSMAEAVRRHGLDPGAHALMADLLLATRELDLGAVEAYAVRALAPGDPMAWRRWGMVEAFVNRDQEAVRAFSRYLELAGIAESDDPEVAALLAQLRRRIPGGDIAQAELGRVK